MPYTNNCKAGITLKLFTVLLATSSFSAMVSAQSTYTYSQSSTSAAWTTTSNWTGGITGTFPGDGVGSLTNEGSATDVAAFGPLTSNASTIGLNFNTAGGALTLSAINALNTASRNLSVGNSSAAAGQTNATLTLNGTTLNGTNNTILSNDGTFILALQPRQQGGSSTFDMSIALGNSTSNVVQVNSSGNVVLATVLKSASGSTPLTVIGAGSGRMDITGSANTFTGTINLMAAESRFSAPGSYGDTSNTIVIDGGRLATASGTTYTLAATHALQLGASAGTAVSVTSSGTLSYSGGISDKPGSIGVLVKQGAGTLALGGSSTYSGATIVNNGTLQLTTAADRLPITTSVNLGQGGTANLGTLDLAGISQQVGGLTSVAGTNVTTANNSVISSTPATLTLGGSGDYSYGTNSTFTSGVITGAVAVVKSGTGIQTLGDDNSYSGGTVITGGTLLANNVAGTTATGPNAVQVSTNTVKGGRLGGSGFISGNIAVNDGGAISPGSAIPGRSGSIGTLSNLGTSSVQTWNGGGKYEWEVNYSTGERDEIALRSLAIDATSDSRFQIQIIQVGLAGPTPNNWTTIAASASGGTLSGWDPTKFELPPNYNIRAVEHGTNTIISGSFSGSFDVQVEGAPEPTTSLLFGSGLLGLMIRRRRRVSIRGSSAMEKWIKRPQAGHGS